MTTLKDSGERIEYEDGGVRDGEIGKGRYDLISPLANQAIRRWCGKNMPEEVKAEGVGIIYSPLSMHRLALWFEAGAVKYEDRNWENGLAACEYIDSGIRHTQKFLCGLEDEDHGAAALWNMHCLTHTLVAVENGILDGQYNDIIGYFSDKPDKGAEFFKDDYIQKYEFGDDLTISDHIYFTLKHIDMLECTPSQVDAASAAMWHMQVALDMHTKYDCGLLDGEYCDLGNHFADNPEVGMEFFKSKQWIQELADKKEDKDA